jgi:hypothetical protein
VHVEVDHVVVPNAVPVVGLLQVLVQRLIGAGAQDVDLDRHLRLP